MRVDVRTQSELKLSLTEATIKSDPHLLEDEMDLSIESANLRITLTNSIPISGTVKLLMGTDTTSMDTLISLSLPHCVVQDHRAIAVDTSYVVNLSEEDFEVMKQPNVYTRQLIEVKSTEGNTVWLYGADSLDVRAHAVIRYTIDPGGNDE